MTTRPDERSRRVAVMLGPGGASRYLLDCLRPLLSTDRDIELQGMFLREAQVRNAAELPFVQELCRVTFAVREFDSDKFERALSLRMRTARKALAVLAEHTGARHSFRDVAGSAMGLLREAIADADITAFEPSRPPMSSVVTASPVLRRRHVAAVLGDPKTSGPVLRAAIELAEGHLSGLTVLLLPDPGVTLDELRALLRDTLPARPCNVQPVDGGDFSDFALNLRRTGASILVVPASEKMTGKEGLMFLRGQARCPVCIVRDW